MDVSLIDASGEVRAVFDATHDEPWFYFPPDVMDHEALGEAGIGWTLRVEDTGDERPIWGLNWDALAITMALAPRPTGDPRPNERYASYFSRAAREGEASIPLRPGTTILGGHTSGFYDREAWIVEAHYTGGEATQEHDWAFRVVVDQRVVGLSTVWIASADIFGPIASPEFVIDLSIEQNARIDGLLNDGHSELFEHFAQHPDQMRALSPERFERLVGAVYRGLGFEVEQLGAWNQADGGVDLLAVDHSAGAGPFTMAIQCKASRNRVDARPVRELAGVLPRFRAHKGIVVTTSEFTGPARAEVTGDLWSISLHDGDDLYRRIMALAHPQLEI